MMADLSTTLESDLRSSGLAERLFHLVPKPGGVRLVTTPAALSAVTQLLNGLGYTYRADPGEYNPAVLMVTAARSF